MSKRRALSSNAPRTKKKKTVNSLAGMSLADFGISTQSSVPIITAESLNNPRYLTRKTFPTPPISPIKPHQTADLGVQGSSSMHDGRLQFPQDDDEPADDEPAGPSTENLTVARRRNQKSVEWLYSF